MALFHAPNTSTASARFSQYKQNFSNLAPSYWLEVNPSKLVIGVPWFPAAINSVSQLVGKIFLVFKLAFPLAGVLLPTIGLLGLLGNALSIFILSR